MTALDASALVAAAVAAAGHRPRRRCPYRRCRQRLPPAATRRRPRRPAGGAGPRCGTGVCRRPGQVEGLGIFTWDADARTAHARVFSSRIGHRGERGGGVGGDGPRSVPGGRPGCCQATASRPSPSWQGAEIGRPSRLECAVVARGGVAVECRVSGAVRRCCVGGDPPAAGAPVTRSASCGGAACGSSHRP